MRLMIHFDRTPLRLRFQLAEPDMKATIAAGIYGGCFYCALELEPKRGLISIDMALEMGAYIGIAFGPFRGHVKFMVGLHYKKDDNGVLLEGYLIAEGVLSVWIISVSARLYMGVRSQNSYVEGFCVASYSVRVGWFKKTFTATYTKRVAGAANNAPSGGPGVGRGLGAGNGPELDVPAVAPEAEQTSSSIADLISQNAKRRIARPGNKLPSFSAAAGVDSDDEVVLQDLFVDEFQMMDRTEFLTYSKQYFACQP
jgi:hypothetical protein